MIQEKVQRLKRVLLFASISLLLISLVGFVWLHVLLKNRLTAEGSRHALPVYSRLPNFSLTESRGRPVGLIDLQGKVWIADFFFTTCPGPCPRMSARMAELQKSLSNHEAARLVSITVDPDNDTPQVLTQYAERFHARKERWFFLTGEKSAIHHLAKDGFLVGGVEDVMLHTTRFMLVDQQGQLRGYYDSGDEESLKQLLADAEILLRERTL
jgi:protein SCO1